MLQICVCVHNNWKNVAEIIGQRYMLSLLEAPFNANPTRFSRSELVIYAQ